MYPDTVGRVSSGQDLFTWESMRWLSQQAQSTRSGRCRKRSSSRQLLSTRTANGVGSPLRMA